MKKKKPKKNLKPNEVLANASKTEDIYMHKMNENLEYKQKKFPDSSDFHTQDVESLDLLIIMQACFILLITMCKTLKDQRDNISSFSNPNFPVTYQVPHVHLQTLRVPVRDDAQLLLC